MSYTVALILFREQSNGFRFSVTGRLTRTGLDLFMKTKDFLLLCVAAVTGILAGIHII